MTSHILSQRDISKTLCPDCGNENTLMRSHSRTITERIVNGLTRQRHYRCKNCGWRGRKFKMEFTKDSLKTLGFYFVLIVVCVVISLIMLRRVI